VPREQEGCRPAVRAVMGVVGQMAQPHEFGHLVGRQGVARSQEKRQEKRGQARLLLTRSSI
jgi:hypothetical protein